LGESQKRCCRALCRAALAFLLLVSLALAQQFRSSVSGVITDPGGATVAGARVTGVQIETGTRYNSVSTSDGRYSLVQLLAGTYRIEVEAPGFKRFVREPITVTADQQVGVSIGLQVGAQIETVTVAANTPLLDTENALQGEVINMRDVDNLPLNGRTPIMFTQLSPGIALTTNITQTTPFDNGQAADWAMGGAAANQNELLLDGNDNTQPEVGQLAYSPPQDAVQHVVVETDDVDAALATPEEEPST
jgi:Carboxypeptidase regulatory-like domain